MNAEVEQRGSSCRENPAVIKQILDHLERLAGPATRVTVARAPPPAALPGLKEHG